MAVSWKVPRRPMAVSWKAHTLCILALACLYICTLLRLKIPLRSNLAAWNVMRSSGKASVRPHPHPIPHILPRTPRLPHSTTHNPQPTTLSSYRAPRTHPTTHLPPPTTDPPRPIHPSTHHPHTPHHATQPGLPWLYTPPSALRPEPIQLQEKQNTRTFIQHAVFLVVLAYWHGTGSSSKTEPIPHAIK